MQVVLVAGTVYDFAVDPHNDFRNRKFVRSICRLIRRRYFAAGMFHTPCATCCIARDRNSQIHTRDFAMGLPPERLSERQQQRVKDGNETVLATVRMIREFDQLGLPWMIENFLSFRLWPTPAVESLFKQSNVELVPFHMCQFGSAWKKPTAVLCGNMPPHLTNTHQ